MDNSAAHTKLVGDILKALSLKFPKVFRASKFQPFAKGPDGPVKTGPKGIADICGVLAPHGRLVCIEVKTGAGRLNDNQEKFHAMMSSMGALCVVARSVKDALDAIEAARK